MDFVSSEKKESSEAIESDAILNGMRFCLEQKILLSWQRDVMALELYCTPRNEHSVVISYPQKWRIMSNNLVANLQR